MIEKTAFHHHAKALPRRAALSIAALAMMSAAIVPTGGAAAQSMDALVAAAKQEGQLTTIALPHDWCGYGALIDGFKAKYGLTVNELNPDAGSGDEIEAIKANKGNTGPQAPDVIDVGLSFGPSAKEDGLLQPYKVATWDTIPDSAKDADGYWYGDYYGVLAFEVNKDIVKNAAGGLGRPAEAGIHATRWRWPAIRAPPTRRSRPSTPPAWRPARGGAAKAGEAGLEVLRRAEQGRQLRAGDRQGGLARAGRDADRHPLGLQRPGRSRHAEGQPAGRGRGARRPASSPASTCRRSAPTRRIRTPPSSGWSTSTPTKASSAG